MKLLVYHRRFIGQIIVFLACVKLSESPSEH